MPHVGCDTPVSMNFKHNMLALKASELEFYLLYINELMCFCCKDKMNV